MTFDEIVLKVQDQKPTPIYIDPWDCDLLEELGLRSVDIDSAESPRLVSREVLSWCCTDTGVGLDVLYLDDEAVALMFQQYRKANNHFLWRDAPAKKQVFDYMVSLIRPQHLEDPQWLATESAIDGIIAWVNDYEFKDGFRSHL